MAPSPLKKPTKGNEVSITGEAASMSTSNRRGYTLDASVSLEDLVPTPSSLPDASTLQDAPPRKQSPSLLSRYKLRSSERAAKEVPSISRTSPGPSREPKSTSFTEHFDNTPDTVYSPARGKRVLRKVKDTEVEMVGKDYLYSPWAQLTGNEKANRNTEEKTQKAEDARQRTMLAEQITTDDSVQQTRVTRSQGRRLERASDGTGTEPKGSKEQSKDWLAIPQALKLHKKHGTGSPSRSPSPQAKEGAGNKSSKDSAKANEATENMTPRAAGKAPPLKIPKDAKIPATTSTRSPLSHDLPVNRAMAALSIRPVPTSPDPLTTTVSRSPPTTPTRDPANSPDSHATVSVVPPNSTALGLPIDPPRVHPTDALSELWTSSSMQISRPVAAWGWLRRWTCCLCGAETMAEQRVCARLECGHGRCEAGCRMFRK